MNVALIGNGYLGQAYERMFPEALVYDEPKRKFAGTYELETGRLAVNKCDIAIVAVPTDPLEDGSLDMSIVEDVVGWLETDTILLKSALMPGTTDRLVAETGKNIAVGVETIGMGNYYIDPSEYPDPKDPWKHKMLIIGGEEPARSKAAEVLWDKMQPNIRIHLVTAKEAEIVKLVENSYPAMKVSFINALFELTEKADANFINVHQAWSSDSRVDGFHMRTTSFKRGWKSHCWSKDIPALAKYAESVGADTMATLMKTVIDINEVHLGKITLSIDDGCASDVRVAELAKKYGIECVFYWPVEWHSLAYGNGYKPLTFIGAKEIADDFEIGSHTITHRHLTKLYPNEAKYEIDYSKFMLEEMLNINIEKFAPPRGYTNPELTEFTLNHYESQRLTKGPGLVHIHPNSGANGNVDWKDYFRMVKERGENDGNIELWGHSWEFDKYNLWDELEQCLKSI